MCIYYRSVVGLSVRLHVRLSVTLVNLAKARGRSAMDILGRNCQSEFASQVVARP